MIEACTGLVPIFGFELKDDSERPRTSHSKKLSEGPRDGGFRMGRYSYMARLQRTEEAARKLNLGTTRSLARAQTTRKHQTPRDALADGFRPST